MEKISIMVPVYNVEMYLEKCLDSIVAQTYKNLEIILIDDGSTDSCPSICDKYAENDSRIIVLHQANKGIANARTAGIEVATSKYIGFVDSDDYIDSEMFEKMYNNMKATDADVVMCNYVHFGLSENVRFAVKNAVFVVGENIDNNARLLLQSNKTRFSPCVWNKLFKRQFLTEVLPKYDEDIRCGEDINLTMLVFLKAKIVSYIDDVLYHYLVRATSIVNSKKLNWKYDEKLISIFANEIENLGNTDILALFKSYVVGVIKNNIAFAIKNNLGREVVAQVLANEYYLKYIDDAIKTEKELKHKIYDILLKHECIWLLKLILK